jgi:hypothetical protein
VTKLNIIFSLKRDELADDTHETKYDFVWVEMQEPGLFLQVLTTPSPSTISENTSYP